MRRRATAAAGRVRAGAGASGRPGAGRDPGTGLSRSSTSEIDGDSGRNQEAESAAYFLRLDRTRNRNFGVELGELLHGHAKFVHYLPFPSSSPGRAFMA